MNVSSRDRARGYRVACAVACFWLSSAVHAVIHGGHVHAEPVPVGVLAITGAVALSPIAGRSHARLAGLLVAVHLVTAAAWASAAPTGVHHGRGSFESLPLLALAHVAAIGLCLALFMPGRGIARALVRG